MNNVNLIGRIANDLELRTTQSGANLCEFRLAVKRPMTTDKTDFINVVVWNKQAENLTKYQVKGNMVAVNGSINVDEYTKDGKKLYRVFVRAEHIEYLTKKEASDDTFTVIPDNE